MTETTEEKVLHLTVGKEVRLTFTAKFERLRSIQLSLNKVSELIRNGLVTQETLTEVDRIGLITKSNHNTYVQVEDIRQVPIDPIEVMVPINKKKTKAKFNPNESWARQGWFEYIVSDNQEISREDLYSLNQLNEESQKNKKKGSK